MMRAMTRYRPAKTADGEGGYTETLGTGVTVYGGMSIDDDEVTLVYPEAQDIVVNDIIAAPDGDDYRVMRLIGPTGASKARARLERIERPING